MRLENILALTRGQLVNDPFVNKFENIVFDVNKVKRGDLFVALNECDIEISILNGAYGIIFDKPTQISDNEIAWIKVENIENALIRLLRFRLIEKDITVYECDEITIKLAFQIVTPTNFIVIDSNIEKIIYSLWNVEDKSIVLFSSDLCNQDIFTNAKKMPQTILKNIKIMEETLFEVSFIYNNSFYERQFFSPFFIPYLEKLLNFFDLLDIKYRLKKFSNIGHFEDIFINKKLEIKDFGTTDKVLIFEQNEGLIQEEINFLEKYAKWGKTIYILPNHKVDNNKNIYYYDNNKEIINIIKNVEFNFALLLSSDKTILNKSKQSNQQLTLEF